MNFVADLLLGDDAAKKKKMKILGIVADERALGTMSCGVEEAFDEQQSELLCCSVCIVSHCTQHLKLCGLVHQSPIWSFVWIYYIQREYRSQTSSLLGFFCFGRKKGRKNLRVGITERLDWWQWWICFGGTRDGILCTQPMELSGGLVWDWDVE